jgi:hypothetical protein
VDFKIAYVIYEWPPRAVWYVKITMAYAAAMTETNKTKKRQASDPCQEWTHTLTR